MIVQDEGRSTFGGAGLEMIHSVEINNFRCYRKLRLVGLRRLNLVVGDNGSGKTALLEAMFLALAASTEVGLRFRQQRGIDPTMGGTTRRLEDGLWGDLFYENDFGNPIQIILGGEGPEARSVRISRGTSEATLPLDSSDLSKMTVAAPVTFSWTDAHNKTISVTPRVQPGGTVVLPETGEDLPNFFFFGASVTPGTTENASRFSELSKANKHRKFVEIFVKEYPWIEDLGIEVSAGAPAVFATIKGSGRKMPVANLSGGINRLLGIMLAIATSTKAVMIIDEIESGIYHTHLTSIWRTLIALINESDSQLFASTHSHECIEALMRASPKVVDDILLLRTERVGGHPHIETFSGETLFAGLQYGEEVR